MSSGFTSVAEQASQISGLIERGVFFFVVLILTLVVLRVIWTGRHQKKTKKLTPTALKTCPDCAEQVQLAARICRYCRYDFTVGSASAVPSPSPAGWPPPNTPGSPPSPYGWPVENQTPSPNPGPK